MLNIKEKKIAVIGLGYVGLPLAVEFSRYFDVIGYDIDKNRIDDLKNGIDKTKEIEDPSLLTNERLIFSNLKKDIKKSNIYIITVPTPVNEKIFLI